MSQPISVQDNLQKKIEKKWEKIRRPQRNLLTFAPSNDERSMCTPGTQHFLSGRREIATCPARKNGRRKEDEKVKKIPIGKR